MIEGNPNPTRWFWAASDERKGGEARAAQHFIIARGKRDLWIRTRKEVSADGRGPWGDFGPESGEATLADCFGIFIQMREMYGVDYNRLVLELAQVKAFAQFIKDRPSDLGNWVSNPVSFEPLPREPYDAAVEQQLGYQIAATLGLQDREWWR